MDGLTRVSSNELVRNFGPLADKALSAPVTITRNGRDRLVLLSAEEYARLKRRDRQVIASGKLPDELLAQAERTEMDARHGHLDALVKDWTP